MKTRRYAPCSLGRQPIYLGRQGENNALRIEFDCSAWLAQHEEANVKLFYFAPERDEPRRPVLGAEGTDRVWIVSVEDTAYAGNGVIELALEDENTGTRIKSATGYTTVLPSPSAGREDDPDAPGYVRYDVDQSKILTDEQKETARKNIGAGTGEGSGGAGEDGGYYTPSVSETGDLSWTPSKAGMPDVGMSNIRGPKGAAGSPGANGVSPTVSPAKVEGGYRIVIQDVQGVKTFVINDGRGIADIQLTDGNGAAGTVDTYTIFYTDGSKSTFRVRNGADGANAEGGASVELDTTLTQYGKAADAGAVGNAIEQEKAAREQAVSELNEAIDAKGDPTDEQVSTAVNAFLTENPVKAGMTATQLALLKILGNYLVFSDATTGQTIFDSLVAELEKTVSGDDTGGDEPDIPDTPDEPETPTSYTVTNSLTNVSTNNSATSVDANAAYTATLTPDSGYSIGSVTITMGGVNVTDTVYADGAITIEAVTGDVVIMASGLASDNLITAEVLAQTGEGSFPDGTLADGSKTLMTPLIPVEPGTTYYTNITRHLPDGTTVWNQKIGEYKEDETFIKALQYSSNDAIGKMTTTADTHYIRCFYYAALTNPYVGKSGVIV